MRTEVIQDTHIIVHAAEEIDLTNITEFRKALDEAAERAPGGFIIDMTDSTYIDSAGVQAIYVAYAQMRESEGRLALVVGNDRISSVLEAVHLELLPGVCVLESLEAARLALPPMLQQSEDRR